MLQTRARARSRSVLLCMVFSVKVEIRPILSLISLSLLAAVLVVKSGACDLAARAAARRRHPPRSNAMVPSPHRE
eukprot:COSAG05_NODE_550_length_8736_cov_153.546254_5_plen_75_part_00